MKRKLLTGLLVVVLLCGTGFVAAMTGAGASDETISNQSRAATVPVFADVASDSWYAEAVQWCREHDIMNGTSDTIFSPNRIMTRAMFATVLYRAAGSPAASGTVQFGDVIAKSWCTDAVIWAAANGIMGGYGNGIFGVNDPVTHEQLVTILWRYDGSKSIDSKLPFTDAGSIHNYAIPAVHWASANGIVSDWGTDCFDPDAGTTRAQAATTFHRYLAGKEESNMNNVIDVSKLEHAVTDADAPTVFMTTEINPDGLSAVYKALHWMPAGKVAVKLSTGEPPASNYLDPNLIKELVQSVHGTIVECNTAYGGSRASTAVHRQVAEDHGFTAIADVDILDADGSISLPVTGGSHLTENFVGSHFKNYDSYLVLSHFKGHAMAGFGGAVKNISIGLASSKGKAHIHSGGTDASMWSSDQNAFLESMGEAGAAVVSALNGQIVYVNVMNRLSVDCDCDGHPAEPDMHDIGILASIDPVALDQACVDLVYAAEDGASLIQRMESRDGIHTLEHAEQIGLGSRNYQLINVDS